MATPDEVRRSLLTAGDGGRDGVARRKVADRVRAVTRDGSSGVRYNLCSPDEVATAASAVVLASDLRAPEVVATFGPFDTSAVRDRLENVERLLVDFGKTNNEGFGYGHAGILDLALAELRSILGKGDK